MLSISFSITKASKAVFPKVRPFILPVRITKTLQKQGILTSNITIPFRNTKIWRMLFYTYKCQRFFILLSLGFAENLQKFSAFLFSQRLVNYSEKPNCCLFCFRQKKNRHSTGKNVGKTLISWLSDSRLNIKPCLNQTKQIIQQIKKIPPTK